MRPRLPDQRVRHPSDILEVDRVRSHFDFPDDDVLPDHAASRLETGVTLPPDAVDTGWQRDGQELWLALARTAARLWVRALGRSGETSVRSAIFLSVVRA